MKKRKTKLWIAFFVLVVVACILIFVSKSKGNLNLSGHTSEGHSVSQNSAAKQDKPSASTHKNAKKVSLDDYLFVGDSYTFLLKDTIKEHNPSATVCAKSGVQPGYWIENFDTLPANDKVKGIVLLIGVNGVTYNDNLPNKEKLIDSLVKKYPDKTIYVQKVFPVGEHFENANPKTFNAAIKSHNEKIENYCKKYDNVVFIDSTKGLVTNDGYLKYTSDGLHISPDKQETFYNNIQKVISNFS
ncbi:GDSL-type esterase/lipase family protein [Terrisporobacter sp.]